MIGQEYIRAMMAQKLWQEDRTDGIVGLTAVGLIFSNRIKSGWYGGDWLRCLADADRIRATKLEGPESYGDPNDPLFQRLLWKVDTIFSCSEEDFTHGALYYADLTKVTSEWFRTEILGKLEIHKRIGSAGKLTFFG
jgi:hypothetical protein